MNIIGLTGANVRAMADAAYLLVQEVTNRGANVAVMVYIDKVAQVDAMRANPLGHTEIWRVGPDPDRRRMDHLVDAFIDDGASLATEVTSQLARYLARLRREVSAAAPTLS